MIMIIKALEDENFTNFKLPAMFIGMPSCTFKCCKEQGIPIEVCQNCDLMKAPSVEVSVETLIHRYFTNPISQAVVFGGMEPLDSWDDLSEFITKFRERTMDPIVIYTGYTESELTLEQVKTFIEYPRIIVKFGRFVPGQRPHYDSVLGIKLASDNQYGKDFGEGVRYES